MSEWIDVLNSDNDDVPQGDDVAYKDRTDYEIEYLLGGSIGNEEIKTIRTTYFEAPDLFIGDDGELYSRYNIWRYREVEA